MTPSSGTRRPPANPRLSLGSSAATSVSLSRFLCEHCGRRRLSAWHETSAISSSSAATQSVPRDSYSTESGKSAINCCQSERE